MRTTPISAVVVCALIASGCAAPEPTTGSIPPSTQPTSTADSTTATTVVEVDPSLAGVTGVVRITDDVEQRAVEWGLYAPDGTPAGPFDLNGDILLLEPIEGYGDLSGYTGQDVFDMDLDWYQQLVFRCVADTDRRFADLIAQTGGFNWNAFEGQLSQVGMAVYVACRQGLRRPFYPPDQWTTDQWAEAYAYRMAWIDCVERATGIDWGPRLTLDDYISESPNYDIPPDHPYVSLDDTTLRRLDDACPPDPPGGFGTWDPGDPVGTP